MSLLLYRVIFYILTFSCHPENFITITIMLEQSRFEIFCSSSATFTTVCISRMYQEDSSKDFFNNCYRQSTVPIQGVKILLEPPATFRNYCSLSAYNMLLYFFYWIYYSLHLHPSSGTIFSKILQNILYFQNKDFFTDQMAFTCDNLLNIFQHGQLFA